MRGYDYSTFINSFNGQPSIGLSVNDLFGSKMALFNYEIRLPFTGPKKIALIKSGLLYTDLSLFTDIGIAWNNFNQITLSKYKLDQSPTYPFWLGNSDYSFKAVQDQDKRIPLVSLGASIRVNVLGYMVVEPYYAFPMQYGGFKNPVFGINFQPGW